MWNMNFILRVKLGGVIVLAPMLCLTRVQGVEALSGRGGALKNQEEMQVTAHSYKRRTIYHSPQTPGYTCWASIWGTPDGGLMITFTQATGSLKSWRPRAPASVLRRMPRANQEIPEYDMTGLVLENVYLRSTDGGKKWRKTGAEPFDSCLNGMCGSGMLALPDGTFLRDVWGQGLPYWDVPPTGFLQRSLDNANTWEPPELLSSDPHLQTWPKRLRRLRDGRLLLTGAASPYDKELWTWEGQAPKVRPCLWVTSEPVSVANKALDQGKNAGNLNWVGPLYLTPEGTNYAGEEWDVAELDNGDLLGVLRLAAFDTKGKFLRQERHQCLLTKQGKTWKPNPLTSPPFPHSGQPELLMTREGVLLHIASNGVWWTADRGNRWQKLDLPGSAYYPSAIQKEDGSILVISHVGSDDPYGKVDQSIVQDVFRIKVQRNTTK